MKSTRLQSENHASKDRMLHSDVNVNGNHVFSSGQVCSLRQDTPQEAV
jgi:hypothetical protein